MDGRKKQGEYTISSLLSIGEWLDIFQVANKEMNRHVQKSIPIKQHDPCLGLA